MIATIIRKIYRIIPAGVPSALVIGMILYLTLFPRPLGDNDIELFEGADKVVHAIMFGAMSFTLALDRLMSGREVTRRSMLLITAITVVAGILIEFAQDAMELGRTADLADALADTLGAIIGIFLFSNAKRKLVSNHS